MANGFAESFEKAFIPAAKSGSDAALELLKEKMKREAEKKTAEQKLANIKAMAADELSVAEKSGADAQTLDFIKTQFQVLDKVQDPDLAEKQITQVRTFINDRFKNQAENTESIKKEKFRGYLEGGNKILDRIAESGGVTANELISLREELARDAEVRSGVSGGAVVQSSAVQTGVDQQQPATQTTPVALATEQKSKPTASILDKPIVGKAQQKAEQKKQEDIIKAEKGSVASYRMLQQFSRSRQELVGFDPEIGKEGLGGYVRRRAAAVATAVDTLPETKAFQVQIEPFANAMAREIEGGKITDQDREIYAKSLISALRNPDTTNIRLSSSSVISMLDKGGDTTGKITNQLKQLAEQNDPIFNAMIEQVLIEYPEMAKNIYGEDYEVIE